MAAADIFKIIVTGKGGHGAQPHLAADPVVASAQIVMSLQSVVSRSLPPLQSAVLSVTMIHGGEAFNVIPAEVELQGTIRTFEPAIRQVMVERIEEIISGTSTAHRCSAKLELKVLTPPVMNQPQVTQRVQEIASQIFPDCQIQTDFQTMGSEDMAFFLQRVPGCFVFMGSANPAKSLDAPHHHPEFDFDEQVLPNAARTSGRSRTGFSFIKAADLTIYYWGWYNIVTYDLYD